ncbi:MAG: hypothetical protein ABMA02_10205, partial [Saprospiraceae bacterium]
MSNFLNSMKNLLLPSALLAVLFVAFACTPKAADKTAATPVKPTPAIQWDTIGKPLVGAEADDPEPDSPEEPAAEGEGEEEAEFTFMDEALVSPDSDQIQSDTLPPYN